MVGLITRTVFYIRFPPSRCAIFVEGDADLVDPSALDAQLVLIHGYDLLVLQYRLVLRPDGPQVRRHQQRGGEYGPYGHLHLTLFVTQTEVADD